MNREFDIVAPDLRLALLPPIVGAVAGLAGIVFIAREQPRLWWLGIVAVAIFVLIFWSSMRRRVSLDTSTGELRILAGFNRARIKATDIDLDAARIVDLAKEPSLRPGLKTFGTSVPGYSAGHFRLRNRGRAFLMLTDRTRVIALPERSGRMLLLSLEKPQALLDALRDMAEKSGRR